MSKRLPTLLASVMVTGLLAAGCGSDDANTSSASSKTSTTHTTEMHNAADSSASGGTETAAAELRAGLTALLQEHVYLAGIAVANGVGNGLDSGEFKAAAGTLDDNSVALSEAIGSVYGDPAAEQFLALWRKHIGFFVTYTKGKATKNAKMASKAKRQLDGYRKDFGAFIASANPNLPADAVAEELKPHVATLFAAIDSVVAGKANAFDRLRTAAGHMPHTAQVLSGAIVKQFPEKFGS